MELVATLSFNQWIMMQFTDHNPILTEKKETYFVKALIESSQ